MKDKKKSLMRELKGTIFLLSTAMLAMWFLFYAYMHNILKSYITDEEFKNLKIHIVNYKPSSYIIVRFELPFQLPLDENGGIYSKKFRKGLKTK